MNISTRKHLEKISSIINGYELGIIQILEKWKVSDRDIDKIQKYIELIEKETIYLTEEKNKWTLGRLREVLD